MQTASQDLSSSGSSSTPDSFLYETKYIVLSFLRQLTQDGQGKGRSKTSAEQRVRQYARHWKTRSLPSSPPKQRKKQKKAASHVKRRPFSSDESLHLRLQSITADTNASSQNSETSQNQPAHLDRRKSQKQTLSGRHSVPLQPQDTDSPDSSKTSSLPTRIALYQRSISDGSSQDTGSYMSDADDELDTSQGSTASSLRGSRSGDFLKASGHHLHVSRLSTVASESEAEPDLQDSSMLNDDDNALPIDVGDIEFDISPDQDDKHPHLMDWRSPSVPVQNGVAESASFDPHRPEEDVVDGQAGTESDMSDFESDESIGVKGDDDDVDGDDDDKEEEEGKLGEAAGGIEETVGDVYNGSTPLRRRPNRSHLFLDLTISAQRASLQQEEVDSVMASLSREIQDEMLSLESEVDDAIRSRRISSQHSLFMAPTATPLTPHSEAAEILARIGDDIVKNHDLMPRVESAVARLLMQESGSVTYEVFREVAKSIVDDSIPGWRQVALLLVYSQSVALKMASAGGQGVSSIVDYSVKLLADLTADFIIKQGGWSGLMTTESSSSCLSSPEPSQHQTNPLLVAEVHAQVTTTTTTVAPTLVPTGEISTSPTDPLHTHSDQVDMDQRNGDVQNTDHSDSGHSVTPTNGNTDQTRGGNSWWPQIRSRDHSFVTKCSATLALLSIGLGLTLAYIKR